MAKSDLTKALGQLVRSFVYIQIRECSARLVVLVIDGNELTFSMGDHGRVVLQTHGGHYSADNYNALKGFAESLMEATYNGYANVKKARKALVEERSGLRVAPTTLARTSDSSVPLFGHLPLARNPNKARKGPARRS